MTNNVDNIVFSPVSKVGQSIETGALMLSPAYKQSLSIEEADGEQQQDMRLLEVEKLRLNQNVVHLEGKLQEVATENEALRKGMHEILDSIHNQDGRVFNLALCTK
jgi:hypothetical protein